MRAGQTGGQYDYRKERDACVAHPGPELDQYRAVNGLVKSGLSARTHRKTEPARHP